MSQLGCVASGNKLQRQKGPWSLGERKETVTHPREEDGKGKAQVWQRGGAHTGSFILRVLNVKS